MASYANQDPAKIASMNHEDQPVPPMNKKLAGEQPPGPHGNNSVSLSADRLLFLAGAFNLDAQVSKRRLSSESGVNVVKRHKTSRAAAALTKTNNAYADADASGNDDSDDVFMPSTTSSPKTTATGSVSPIVRTTGPSTPRAVTKATVTASDKKVKEDEKAVRDEKYQRDKNTGYFPRSVASQYSGVKEYKTLPMPLGFTKALRASSPTEPHRKTVTSKPVAPRNVTPMNATPMNVTPKNVMPKNVTPMNATLMNVTPEPVTPNTVTPMDRTSEPVIPKTVTPKLIHTIPTHAIKQEPTMPENNPSPFTTLLTTIGWALGALKSSQDIAHAKLNHIAHLTASAANDDATGVRLTDYRELLENISAFAAEEAAVVQGLIVEAEMNVAQALDTEAEEKLRGLVKEAYVDRKEVLAEMGIGDDWDGVFNGR